MKNEEQKLEIQKEDFEPDNLTSITQEQAKKDLQCMEDLDKIKTPIEAKMYSTTVWTYRNKSYREFVNKMDQKAKEELFKLVNKKLKI